VVFNSIYYFLFAHYTTAMSNKKLLQFIALVVLAAIVLFVIKRKPQAGPQVTDFQSCQAAGGAITDGEPVTCTALDGHTFAEQVTQDPEVVVDTPQYGDLVSSPLQVSGKARGFWFFEGQMPVTLKDDQGNVLVKTPAHANGDWMTQDFVPFTATLNFNPGDAQYGVLVIEKDNPSGDPQFDAAFAVPVRFK
jgi:hypothetical protein